jgi:hypothetical protein
LRALAEDVVLDLDETVKVALVDLPAYSSNTWFWLTKMTLYIGSAAMGTSLAGGGGLEGRAA